LSLSIKFWSDFFGYVEDYGRYAKEEDQWLFACAYYKSK